MIEFFQNYSLNFKNTKDQTIALKEIINETVNFHQVSDTPITVLLSSGIDSNVILSSISNKFHEQPNILHYGKKNNGLELTPGMTFTIEPMINAGKRHTRLLGDGWTVITKDRKSSAQYEHTILVTNDGHEVLTRRQEESF